MSETHDRMRDRTGVRLALGGVVLLLAALYAAGYFFLGNRIAAGVEVADVSISGLTPDEARERLERELVLDHPMEFTAGEETFTVDPAEAGLAFDLEATVAEAGGGRSFNPLDMLDVLWGAEDVAPVVDVDEAALDAVVSDLAAEVDVARKEPRITFPGGQPDLRPGVPGLALDRGKAARVIADAYLMNDEPVALPVAETEPTVSNRSVEEAMQRARTAVSGPVRLNLPSRVVDLPVRTYARALSMAADGDTLRFELDVSKLGGPLDRLMGRVASEPRNAKVVLRDGQPVVVPARKGVTVKADVLADALVPVLDKTGKARSAKVGTATLRPTFSTKQARDLRIREVVSSFVTYYEPAEYRNINQGRAAELINGTVLRPGETFSFNQTVGERTEENGFVVGTIIDGGIFKEDLGGGVSQVVTTTFNAAFFAGMEDVEHKPHSFYISRYPLGREATVAWPTVDLKFKNTTPHGVLIEAWVVPSTSSSSGEMHVRMWSTKYWDIRTTTSERYNFTDYETRRISDPSCVPQDGYSGFDVDVVRKFFRNGSLVKDETMHTTYTPSTEVICV